MDGLAYMHKSEMIHRDIKAGNILLNMKGEIFLSDFGVSATMKLGQKRDTLAGSPCWMAPEVMTKGGHDFKADIWSLGITAIELALGDAPNSTQNHMKVMKLIIEKPPPTLPEEEPWSEEFRNFVKACL